MSKKKKCCLSRRWFLCSCASVLGCSPHGANLSVHLGSQRMEMELCPGAWRKHQPWSPDHSFGGGGRMRIKGKENGCGLLLQVGLGSSILCSDSGSCIEVMQGRPWVLWVPHLDRRWWAWRPRFLQSLGTLVRYLPVCNLCYRHTYRCEIYE